MRELFWRLEFWIYIFRPMRMTDAILPRDLPRQHKRLWIALLFSLPHLLAAGQTSLNEKSAFALFFLPGLIQRQTDGHFNTRECILSLSLTQVDSSNRWTSQHERAHSTFDYCFFRRPFFHLLLLSPKINQTNGWMLNSCSFIYNCPSSIITYSIRVLFISSCY